MALISGPCSSLDPSASEDMVYTLSRLENALCVFRESEEYRTRNDLPAEFLKEHLASKYSLRTHKTANFEKFDPAPAYWDDDDGSGDYVEYAPRKKTKRNKRKQAADDDLEKGGKSGKPTKRPCRRSELVTLRLHSDAGLLKLQDLAKRDHASQLNNITDLPNSSDSEEPSPFSLSNRSLRSSITSQYSLRDINAQGLKTYSDDQVDLDLSSITLGNPTARGCEQCFQLRERCSLLDDEFAYPCRNCVEQGETCKRILPVNSTHEEGTRRSKVKTRSQTASGVPKCDNCRTFKRKCSGRKGSQQHSCPQCLLARTECSFELPLTPTKTSARPKAGHSLAVVSPAVSGPIAFSKTIDTYWAHPIAFCHSPTESLPCHFCQDHRYGLFGLGKKTVDLIAYPNTAKFEELGNGHRADNCEPTRMCGSCVLDKYQISSCVHGTISPICHETLLEGLGSISTEDTVQFLFHESCQLPQVLVPECSICLSAGFFACSHAQSMKKFDETEGRESGCGLVLCNDCSTAWSMTHSLAHIAKKVEREGRILRADVEFLLPDSYIRWAA